MTDVYNKPFYVLGDDIGYIKLIDTMPSPQSDYSFEQRIVSSARMSTNGGLKGEALDTKLLKRLWKDKHFSPFEMAQIFLEIKAPLVVWMQWLRHRTMSYNQQSYRYVEVEEDEFYIPSVWRLQSKTNNQSSSGFLDPTDSELVSEKLRQDIFTQYHTYKELLKTGIAREQARFFLPAYALYSKGVMSVNLRNLTNFLNLRSAEDAQWEIRQYSNCILYDILPALYSVTEKLTQFAPEQIAVMVKDFILICILTSVFIKNPPYDLNCEFLIPRFFFLTREFHFSTACHFDKEFLVEVEKIKPLSEIQETD